MPRGTLVGAPSTSFGACEEKQDTHPLAPAPAHGQTAPQETGHRIGETESQTRPAAAPQATPGTAVPSPTTKVLTQQAQEPSQPPRPRDLTPHPRGFLSPWGSSLRAPSSSQKATEGLS